MATLKVVCSEFHTLVNGTLNSSMEPQYFKASPPRQDLTNAKMPLAFIWLSSALVLTKSRIECSGVMESIAVEYTPLPSLAPTLALTSLRMRPLRGLLPGIGHGT